MKHTAIILGLLLIPSVSFAQLTQNQANSLILVVQSSTTTPASAFTQLITSFSGITNTQAITLINVIQKAPGVPANAFVDMLLAFTVDPTPVLGTTQPAQPQPTQITPIVDNTPIPVAPVVQSAVMPPQIDDISIDHGILHISSYEPLDINKTILPTGITMGAFDFNDKRSRIGRDGVGHGYGVRLVGLPADFTPIDITLTGMDGGQITKSVIVRTD